MTSTPAIRFHSTMTRRTEAFFPLIPGAVRMYTCGPTVYDHAHIGNFRAYVWEDLLRRFLKHRGFAVTQVMNITDVDDKTIRNSLAAGLSLRDYTDQYIRGFFEDIDRLGIERAEMYPRATDHVPEMLDIIRSLSEKGHTYESGGSTYFRIDTFAPYGRLSGLDPAGIQAGARVESDEYEKDDVRDFVLWKAGKEGEPSWPAPIGEGRPGWHIECSAMSMKYLGPSFDIHTGAVDNIFPHHENEIAQSEASTGATFVRLWMHCAHLVVDGEKMSKSKGNFYTLRDLVGRGLDPRAIRYFLLSSHYRKPLNFTIEGVQQTAQALERLDAFRERLDSESHRTGTSPPAPDGGGLEPRVRAHAEAFEEALADDLNTAEALGAIFEMVRTVNAALDRGGVDPGGVRAAVDLYGRFQRVFGVRAREDAALPPELAGLVEARQEARRRRDFSEADRLRKLLLERGITLEDTPGGVRFKRST
ncbi:MAG: cysteine--tRNA ligase [Acidobacteria bacterium]|nr:cysteine--tRNA ligase [Acidobacteriota bacterium]